MEEDLLSKDLFDLPPKGKALFDLLVVAIISVIAFVSAFAVHKPRLADKLVILVECKSRLADKIEFAKCKPKPAGNSFDEVTGTFTARD